MLPEQRDLRYTDGCFKLVVDEIVSPIFLFFALLYPYLSLYMTVLPLFTIHIPILVVCMVIVVVDM